MVTVAKKPKIVKKTVSKTAGITAVKTSAPKKGDLTIAVFDTAGKEIANLTLLSALFGVTPNKHLIAQAIRVYLANQREGGASTKTRGEVRGSTRKIYKQKGTGRARHGAIRAPIFVGGGIVFGPRTRDFSMVFPKTMKRKALYSALSYVYKKGIMRVVDGFSSLPLKTKSFAEMIKTLGLQGSILVVLGKETRQCNRGLRNIEGVDVVSGEIVTTYDVMTHKTILFTKDAITMLEDRVKEEKE